VDGHEYEFAPEDFAVETHEREGHKVEREGGLAVAIATTLSPELVREGLARELVHHIQNTRKAADFQIDDRIHLRVTGPAEIAGMLAIHGDWVKKETLALSLEVGEAEAAGSASGGAGVATSGGRVGEARGGAQGAYREELKVNGLPVTVEVAKA
jgi:isoleucyl-tRNA synthetase